MKKLIAVLVLVLVFLSGCATCEGCRAEPRKEETQKSDVEPAKDEMFHWLK